MRKFFTCSKSIFIAAISFITAIGSQSSVSAQTTNYSYTGALQTYVVPPGVFAVKIQANGAQGGNPVDKVPGNTTGGKGSYAEGILLVAPGQTLNIYIGGQGTTDGTVAFNGGGGGGNGVTGGLGSCASGYAGGGGGATDVRFGGTALTDRVLVAGGGGGAGRDYCYGTCLPCGCGGSGGGGDVDGTSAQQCASAYSVANVNGGKKGTLTATANNGISDDSSPPGGGIGLPGFAGVLGIGGTGAGGLKDVAGGGGGGGYYGGGGGGGARDGSGRGGGGGGGGSSYVTGLYNTLITPDNNTGNGSLSITVMTSVAITLQPSNSAVCLGNSTSFTTATSDGTAFQWQKLISGVWTDLTNTGIHSGVTTATLVVTNPTLADHGNQYRCVISNATLAPATTNTVLLSVTALPTITGTTPGTTCVGANGSVSATPSTGAEVQWYDQLTAGTLLGTGNTLNITGAAATKTYYADAKTFENMSGGLAGGNANIGMVFDVVAKNNITLTDITWRAFATGTYNVKVYIRVGTWVGFETNPAGWTQVATVSGLAMTTGGSHKLVFHTPYPLTNGQRYGIHIAENPSSNLGVVYTNGTAVGNLWKENPDLQMYVGSGANAGLFGVISHPNRMFDGLIGYSSAVCSTVARTPVTLTVNTAPAVPVQPVNRTICAGGGTTFAVTATGTNLNYQWEFFNGTVWANATGGIYSGGTTNTLTLTGATAAVNNFQYRCVVSNTGCTAATSNAATLSVNTAPVITFNPNTSTICSGGNTSFTVAASGTNLTYQWEVFNGTVWANATGGIYTGGTTNTLTLTGATAIQNGFQYRCVVSNTGCTSATSSTTTLIVNTAPAVTVQPVNRTICTGGNTTFAVTATGTNLNYQWEFFNGTVWANATGGIYSGGTTNTLTLTGATAAANGFQYRCVVSNTGCTNATSTAVTLTVNTAPAITTHPTTSTICAGGNTSFTVAATGTNLSYQWEFFNGTLWANATGGIYSGGTTNTLTLTGATAAANGFQYRCVVSNTGCTAATSNAATLTVNTAPAVTVQPVNRTICAGGGTTFGVTATGTNLNYQWEFFNGTVWANATGGIYTGGTTNTLTLTGATVAVNNFQYRCQVSNTGCTNATSTAATLTITTAPVVTVQPVNRTICDGGNTTFGITATGTGLTYQWEMFNGTVWASVSGSIFSNTNTNTLTLTGAGNFYNNYQFRCVVTGSCTPAVTSNAATLTVNKLPQVLTNPVNRSGCVGGSTQFTVNGTGTGVAYQWEVNSGSGFTAVVNNATYAGAATNTLSISGLAVSMNGYQYRCIVSGTCPPSVTTTAATLTVNSNTVITASPTDKTICSGSSTTFSVSATGSGLSYQWYFTGSGAIPNAAPFANVTGATLNVNAYTLADGNITRPVYCQVTGACGVQNSASANLVVHANTAIGTQPVAATICENGTAVFTVAATGSNLSYQWQVNSGSGYTNVTNTVDILGATTNKLTLNKTPLGFHNRQYRCIVTGFCGTVNSSGVTLTVNPTVVPAITITPGANDICAGTSVTFNSVIVGTGTYQWRVNGTAVGTGASYTSSTLNNNDVVICVLTSTSVCRSTNAVTSNPVTMTVTPLSAPTVTVTSSSGATECSGVAIKFTAAITNGGLTPGYQWRLNGSNIPETNPTFTTSTLNNGDEVDVVLTSSLKCPSPKTVTSNKIKMTINQTTRSSIVIASSPDTTICRDDEVTLYTYYTNGGALPKYEWLVNGTTIAGAKDATLKTKALNDGDVVRCRFISSALCVFPELSNPVKFKVLANIQAYVDIVVSYNGNNSYTFTAIPTNGGSAPKFNWFVNGVLQTEQSATFTSELLKKTDRVSVQMFSSELCTTTEYVSSRLATTGVDQISSIFNELELYPNPNTGRFTLKGQYKNSTGRKTAGIKVLNAVGQTVYEDKAEIEGGQLKHNVQMATEPAAGMYMLQIVIEDHIETIRFSITR